MPLPHRMSHARSCAVHVSEKHRVEREVIIALVKDLCGVDLMVLQSSEAIGRAIAILNRLRMEGLNVSASSSDAANDGAMNLPIGDVRLGFRLGEDNQP